MPFLQIPWGFKGAGGDQFRSMARGEQVILDVLSHP